MKELFVAGEEEQNEEDDHVSNNELIRSATQYAQFSQLTFGMCCNFGSCCLHLTKNSTALLQLYCLPERRSAGADDYGVLFVIGCPSFLSYDCFFGVSVGSGSIP